MRGLYPPSKIEDPKKKYGLNENDLENFRKDKEIIEAVRLFTGRDFPMSQLDDALLVEIAGAVEHLGVQEAVKQWQKMIPRELKVMIRGIAMKQRIPLARR